MNQRARVNAWAFVLLVVVGIGAGHGLQVILSGSGRPPFVPPLSLPATLLILAVILVYLGIRLARAVQHQREGRVNPFHAVRLLAGARAGQFSGALFFGFGVGLAILVLTRTVPAAPATWAPMVAAAVAGALLFAAGLFAERSCRIPPDDESAKEPEELPDGEPDPV